LAWLAHAAAAVLAFGCSGPADKEQFQLTLPTTTDFNLVSDSLESRCGTLDCHGSLARNMRLYGFHGVRLKKGDISGMGATSSDEYTANYESVVTISPEVLSAIVARKGQGFDKWIVVTKGSGAENHKGGSRFVKNDVTYGCLLSWIQGTVNMDACMTSATVIAPDEMMPPSDGSAQPPAQP
jgi:hypothetical protein